MLHALLLAAASALTPAQIDTVVVNVEKEFHRYIFPNVAAKTITTLKSHRRTYEQNSDPKALVKAINADLLAVTHDKHVELVYPFHEQERDSPQSQAERYQEERLLNFGFLSVQRLPGDVGYFDFRFFSPDPGVGRTVESVMGFLANTNALIIDLRKNSGGNPITAQTLEAYFFPRQKQITSIIERNPDTGKTEEHQQFTAATVPGPLYLEKPVYLLTSSHTFSAAEQFAYDLRNLKRVTIVGETTGGGANPGDIHAVGEGFAVFIPQGRAYSPVTKTNWEGTGISPDTSARSVDALRVAYLRALADVKKHETNSDVLDEIRDALADPDKSIQTLE